MPTTTNLTTLKINYLTQAQYDNAVANHQINENELYMTPAAQGTTNVTVSDTLATGTKIATITVDDTDYDVYAPSAGSAVAITNLLVSGDRIATISVDGTSYDINIPSPEEIRLAAGTGITLTRNAAGTQLTIAVDQTAIDFSNYLTGGHLENLRFSGTRGAVSVKGTPSGGITATANSSGNYTPAGTVSQPIFSNGAVTASGKYTPRGSVSVTTTTGTYTVSKANSGTATYTPQGSVTVTTNQSHFPVSVSDTGDATYTPSGTISQPTFSGSSTTSSGTFTPAGSVTVGTSASKHPVSQASSGTTTYTPAGTVSAGSGTTNYTPAGTISTGTGTANYTPAGSINVELNTATVNSITDVGTLPTATMPTLTFARDATDTGQLNISWTAGSFSQGTLPTKGANQTVRTSVKTKTFTGTGAELKFTGTGTHLGFTGTAVRLETDSVTSPNGTNSFTGTAGTVSVTGTPSGTISTPTFSGDAVRLETALIKFPTGAGSFSGTGARLVTESIPIPSSATFTGTEATINVSGTATGTVSQPTFTGTKVQLAFAGNELTSTGTFTPAGSVTGSFVGEKGGSGD